MTRYLTSAIVAEGSSDDRFLPRLLTRALEVLCVEEFEDPVDVVDVVALREHGGPARSVGEIVEMVERNSGSFVLVFVHRDEDGSDERVRERWLAPLRERWGDRTERMVAVVPVRGSVAGSTASTSSGWARCFRSRRSTGYRPSTAGGGTQSRRSPGWGSGAAPCPERPAAPPHP